MLSHFVGRVESWVSYYLAFLNFQFFPAVEHFVWAISPLALAEVVTLVVDDWKTASETQRENMIVAFKDSKGFLKGIYRHESTNESDVKGSVLNKSLITKYMIKHILETLNETFRLKSAV